MPAFSWALGLYLRVWPFGEAWLWQALEHGVRGGSAWVRDLRPGKPDSVHLLFFPPAGGSAIFFLPLARALPQRVDALAVQYPGRQDRWSEPPLTDVGEIARAITAELRIDPGRPLGLFGHSFGALVAFEVAAQLQAEDRAAAALFVSGRVAPTVASSSSLHRLPEDDLVRALSALGGTSSDLLYNDESRRLIMPPLRADLQASETYVHSQDRLLECPIFALCGTRDPVVPVEHAMRWGDCTMGEFGLELLPGGHFFVNENTEAVSMTITKRLDALAAS